MGVDGFRHARAVDGFDASFVFNFIRVVGGQVLNAGFKLCLECLFHQPEVWGDVVVILFIRMVSKFGSEEELFAEHLIVGLGWHDQGLSVQVVGTGHLGAAKGSSEGRILAGLKLLPLRVTEGRGPNGCTVVD